MNLNELSSVLRPELINYVSVHTLMPSSELLPDQEGRFKTSVENRYTLSSYLYRQLKNWTFIIYVQRLLKVIK